MSTDFEKANPFIAYKLPALLYAVLIFVMSALPGDELPDLSYFSLDKFVHAAEFGLFGILLFRAFRFPGPIWKPYLVTLLIGIPYAALDEIHQLFVPGRSCDVYDFVMDTAGILVFAAISRYLHRSA